MSQKTLKSLLDPSHGVPFEEDFDALSLARNLVSGSLKDNYKQPITGGFEINLQEKYTLAEILSDQKTSSADEYYTVPYKCTMWTALEEAGAEKARRAAIAAVPGDTRQEKLDFLLKCNCCERHNIDKPGSLNDTHLCSGGLLCSDVDPGCPCSCRHVARWIVREQDKPK